MKKLTIKLIALCLTLILVSCGKGDTHDVSDKENPQDIIEMPNPQPNPELEPEEPPKEELPFPGKIAIVTNTLDSNYEEYESAEAIQKKYGADKVIHRTWPVNFAAEGEMMVKILQEIAEDEDLKALIINQAVLNTNAAVEKFREKRDDVFIVYCTPAENPDDVAARADLILTQNELDQGPVMVDQAIKMGAETFVHYSFPRHMSVPTFSMRRDQIKQACEEKGIRFEDVTCLDTMAEGGMHAAQMHIAKDVPKQVERLGKDTAFFSTNCGLQIPLIAQIVECGAIYPQPCCPSPYHGFPTALGIATNIPSGEYKADGEEIMRMRDVKEVIAVTRNKLAAKGMLGRLSTWPVPQSMLNAYTGAEYAIEWINGNVPNERGNIDLDTLSRIFREQILEFSGEHASVTLNTYDTDDVGFVTCTTMLRKMHITATMFLFCRIILLIENFQMVILKM